MTLTQAKSSLLQISADKDIDRQTAVIKMVHVLYEVQEDIRRVFGRGLTKEDFDDCFQESVMNAYTFYDPDHSSEKTFFGYFELILRRNVYKKMNAQGHDVLCMDADREDDGQTGLSERLADPAAQDALERVEDREAAMQDVMRLSALILQLHDAIEKKTDRIAWQHHRLCFTNEMVDALRGQCGRWSLFGKHERDLLQTMDMALIDFTYLRETHTLRQIGEGKLKTYRDLLADHPKGDDELETPFISKVLQAYWFFRYGETRSEVTFSNRRRDFADIVKEIFLKS